MAIEINNGEEKRIAELTAILGKIDVMDCLAKLGHKRSRRSRQRAIALYLGAESRGHIRPWTLRSLLRQLGWYNSANFAQDMTKDAKRGLWDGSVRSGWTLTAEGTKLADEVVCSIREAYARIRESIKKSFTLVPKTARCVYCREDMTGDDRAECDGCKATAHATCLYEFGRECDRCKGGKRKCRYCWGSGKRYDDSPCSECGGVGITDEACSYCEGTGVIARSTCINAKTTWRCGGTFRTIASPEWETPEKREPCTKCATTIRGRKISPGWIVVKREEVIAEDADSNPDNGWAIDDPYETGASTMHRRTVLTETETCPHCGGTGEEPIARERPEPRRSRFYSGQYYCAHCLDRVMRRDLDDENKTTCCGERAIGADDARESYREWKAKSA